MLPTFVDRVSSGTFELPNLSSVRLSDLGFRRSLAGRRATCCVLVPALKNCRQYRFNSLRNYLKRAKAGTVRRRDSIQFDQIDLISGKSAGLAGLQR